MIHQSKNDWMLIYGINKKQCVYCDIGYCRIGEKDGVMIHVRWQYEVIMKWFEMIECGSSKSCIQSVLKDVVSVILVLVTLVSRSQYWIGIVVRYSRSVSKCQTTGFI